MSLARAAGEASSASGSRSQRMTVDELRRLAEQANKSGIESRAVPYQELRWDPGVMEEAAAVKREQLAAITANIRRPPSSPIRGRDATVHPAGGDGTAQTLLVGTGSAGALLRQRRRVELEVWVEKHRARVPCSGLT